MEIQCVLMLQKIPKFYALKTQLTYICPKQLRKCIVVVAHRLQWNLNLGHQWQLGENLNGKVGSMGNAMQDPNMKGAFFPSIVL